MQIIIEGPDNAGKSTLAKFLSKVLNIPLQHSGGPSKFPGEVNTRCFEFNQRRATFIYDRYPAISQNIYAAAFDDGRELVSEENVEQFYADNPLIIYCRNDDRQVEEGGHVASEHSTQRHADMVTEHFEDICELYDAWALSCSSITYRIGDDMNNVARMVAAVAGPMRAPIAVPFDPLRDIVEFHEKFDLEYRGKPRLLPEDLAVFRGKFMQEELNEWNDADYDARGALDIGDEAEFVHQLELQFDAMIDLMYVKLGTVYLQGFLPLFAEGWNRVHAANMKKIRAANADESASNTGRGHASDVIKPPGWEPPKHTDLIEDHAHQDEFRKQAAMR